MVKSVVLVPQPSSPCVSVTGNPRLPTKWYLADDEELLALHHSLLELLLQGHPYLLLILVHLGTVDVAVPEVNCYLHSLGHLAWR